MDPQSWNEDYAEKILGRKKPIIPKSSVEDLIPSNPEVKCEVDPMELGPNTSQDNSEIVEDVLECKLTDPLTTSSAQFSCSECQATFDTRKKCMNHKADVHSAKENQSRGAEQKNEADRIELPQDEGGDRENEWQASSSPWATAPPSGRRAHGIYEHFDDCPDDPKYSICKHCGRKVCDESNIFDMWTLLA